MIHHHQMVVGNFILFERDWIITSRSYCHKILELPEFYKEEKTPKYFWSHLTHVNNTMVEPNRAVPAVDVPSLRR